jgi:hypothetical protein
MYSKPTLEKFGTFRELTQLGFFNASDGASGWGVTSPGCGGLDGSGPDCPAGATAS